MEPTCHELGEALWERRWKDLASWRLDSRFSGRVYGREHTGWNIAIAALTSVLGLTISEQTWGCVVSLVFLAVAGEIC